MLSYTTQKPVWAWTTDRSHRPKHTHGHKNMFGLVDGRIHTLVCLLLAFKNFKNSVPPSMLGLPPPDYLSPQSRGSWWCPAFRLTVPISAPCHHFLLMSRGQGELPLKEVYRGTCWDNWLSSPDFFTICPPVWLIPLHIGRPVSREFAEHRHHSNKHHRLQGGLCLPEISRPLPVHTE